MAICASVCAGVCFRFLERLIGSGGVGKDHYITVFSIIERQTRVPGVPFASVDGVCHYEERLACKRDLLMGVRWKEVDREGLSIVRLWGSREKESDML